MLWAIAQEPMQPVIEQLDPPRRAAVIMALLGLVLTGLLLVTLVMLGGHWVRRMARHKPAATGSQGGTTSGRRMPLALQDVLPDIETSETVHLDTSSRETKAES